MENIAAIILAAGKGVRMKSDLPKVFHELRGKPMLQHVVETVQKLGVKRIIIIVGHKKELIIGHFNGWPVEFAAQSEQLGTGHAVMTAESHLKDFDGDVLVLAGDVPLLSRKTLENLVDFHRKNGASATDLTAVLPDAGNYGRVVRDAKGHIARIVEKKDATPEELRINEINTGTFCFKNRDLFTALSKLENKNAQKEYYLTDTAEIMKKNGLPVFAFAAEDYRETLGVNTREELAELENRPNG